MNVTIITLRAVITPVCRQKMIVINIDDNPRELSIVRADQIHAFPDNYMLISKIVYLTVQNDPLAYALREVFIFFALYRISNEISYHQVFIVARKVGMCQKVHDAN